MPHCAQAQSEPLERSYTLRWTTWRIRFSPSNSPAATSSLSTPYTATALGAEKTSAETPRVNLASGMNVWSR